MNTMKQLITRFTILGLIVTLFQVNFALGGLSSLFNRQRLFQRTPVQQTNQNQNQNQQQQVQQSHQQPQDHLIFAANSLSPNHFNPFNIRHDDLLRLGAAQKNAVKHQQMLNQQHEFAAINGVEPANHISFEQATQPAAHYSSQQQQQLGSLEQSPMLGHQYSASSHFVQPLISYQKQQIMPSIAQDPRTSSDGHPNQQQQQHFISNLDHPGSQIPAAIIESSQTEIVDKIERHIGRQIEQGLKDSSPSGSEQRAASGEKESSASGEESGESAEEAEEPKVEKRHEGHKSEPEEHVHHEENPPEAFEIHHKKGGKSFQYFHQGHSK